ncbi:zinc-ribbon domain-containing protein [Foetidibacter luteolus]|uniref:zinc-ribbon domain-containing protein n=1 Tax=Foetidibacter luteolus TaxID=2608880 RepID=UPI00129A5AD8|nr:zinc-ribbon domain-containing protein [Foetidibacter luteolus]
MIIYGGRASEITQKTLTGKCPNCEKENAVRVHFFQKYVHVFWVPLIPVEKTAVSQCSSCKQVLKEKEMPDSLKVACSKVKNEIKTPLWTFAGFAVIGSIIISGIINSKLQANINAGKIMSPQNGDVLEIKTKSGEYTIYRVESVQDSTVFIKVSDYVANMPSGLSTIKHKGEKAYSDKLFAITKSKLKKMLDEERILNIDRDE